MVVAEKIKKDAGITIGTENIMAPEKSKKDKSDKLLAKATSLQEALEAEDPKTDWSNNDIVDLLDLCLQKLGLRALDE